MSIQIRRIEPSDCNWAADLLLANSRSALSEDDASSQGFVQGEWNAQKLETFSQLPGPGLFVATVDSKGAGYAGSTLVSALKNNPPASPMGQLYRLAEAEFSTNPGSGNDIDSTTFSWGPVVVDRTFRGQGLLRRLQDAVFASAAQQGLQRGVAFVERSNPVSAHVHQHLGWKVFGSFEMPGARVYDAMYRPVTR